MRLAGEAERDIARSASRPRSRGFLETFIGACDWNIWAVSGIRQVANSIAIGMQRSMNSSTH